MCPASSGRSLAETPNAVLVYGDTNSTLAGALAAAKLRVPVAHVEAGLRSFDRSMPEELNRILVDHLSALLFCPSDAAVENLRREGIIEGVRQVGDVMMDANVRLAPLARDRSSALADADVEPGSYLLLTLHREANVEPEPLRSVVAALEQVGRAGRLSGPSANPSRPRASRHRPSPSRSASCPRRIPRLRRARLAGPARPHGLGRRPEGGLLVPSALPHPSRLDGVGRDTRDGVEPSRRDQTKAIVAAVSSALAPDEHPPLYGDGHASEQIVQVLLDTISGP